MLTVTHLTGGYSRLPVIKDLNFTVKAGEIVGLIGLNGAGKSTTINHLIGLLTPHTGEIELNGISLQTNPQKYKEQLAYIPEMPVLYEELTLREHIEMVIMAYHLDHDQAWQDAQHLLHLFRLTNKLDWLPANFSKGMKQKVMITCAFITQAQLFIIDEPFLGLDPLAVKNLLTSIRKKADAGAGVLMSTHVLSTAQTYCDRFIMLDHGQIIAHGTLTDLQTQAHMADANLTDIYLALTQEGGSDE